MAPSNRVHRALLLGERNRLVVYRLYWVDGRLTASDYGAKALLAWSRLTGGRGDAALVVVYAPWSATSGDVAREALRGVVARDHADAGCEHREAR